MRASNLRKILIDSNTLHLEEVLSDEADLMVDVIRVEGVSILQSKTISMIHVVLFPNSQ